MILMCIAINGDNEQLVRNQLADLLEDEFKGHEVYRAWTQKTDQTDIDRRLEGPREVRRP